MHRLTLAAVELCASPEPAVQAGRLQTVLAELTRAIGPCKGSDHQIALFHLAHFGTHIFDETDELMAHASSGLAGFHLVVGPKIASADAGARSADQSVGGLNEVGVRDVLNPVRRGLHT